MNAIRYRWDGTRYRFIVEAIAEQPDGTAAMHLISKHETAADAAAAALKLRARRNQEEGESVTDAISLELHRAVVAQHGSAFDVLREAHIILDGIIGPDGRKIAARLQDVAADRTTNAALAERVQALEAALDKAADELATARNNEAVLAARCESLCIVSEEMARQMMAAHGEAATLRAVIEQVTWEHNCLWCGESHGKHAADCPRQAALAQTAQEVKHGA